MNTMKMSLLGGALALIAAGCATPTAEPTAVPVPTEEPTEEMAEAMAPAVKVSDQDASGGTVTIDEVVSDGPGWLVIHITRDGGPGPVIGQSAVEAGSNMGVTVDIDLDKATGQLFAMLHVDAGTVGEYEFPGDDAPVFVDDVIVNVPFEATFPVDDSVTAEDQAAVDGTVTIAFVSAAAPGWIVIHAQADGAPGPVIGSAPIFVGYNADVAVEIDMGAATDTLYAMMHLDLGAAGVYEFPGDDVPVFDADGNVVLAPFALLAE
ncbi:MAG: hypothetical protein QGM45_09745 [Anaerolineales bacterium]|nr:hypothetical protein [Anaerolineales bacterium]